jgi:glucose/arabinose dehydrogenase
MRGRLLVAALLAAALSFALPPSARAVDLPPSFAVDDAAPGAGFVLPTQIAFLPDGRFFVAEKRGRVYEVRGGIKQPTPIWSGENEVLNNGDRGLIGLAVDPNYFVNHYLYLVYTVEPDSSGKDTAGPAFSRLTRYQVNFTDSAAVIPSSRTILMGVDWPHGPISASSSHTIGALHFGRDGSLLVASGDGAEFNSVDLGGQEPGGFGAG